MTDLSADLAMADAEARESRERVRFEAFISASDDFTHWQLWCAALAPAVPPGYVLVPMEPTPEMVAAYLAENDAYWIERDELVPPPGKWRTGTPAEATARSYSAMVSAAPSAKEQTCPKN